MKQVQRAGKSVKFGVMNAVDRMLSDLNSYDAARWTVEGYTFEDRYVTMTDTNDGSKHAITIYTDGSDFYAFPWFVLDAGDNGWMGYSANNQAFELVNEQPVLVDY